MKQWMPGATRYKKGKNEALATLVDEGVKVESRFAIKFMGRITCCGTCGRHRLIELGKLLKVRNVKSMRTTIETMPAVMAEDGNIEANPVLELSPDENLL